MKKTKLKKFVRFCSSLKFAVIIIVLLGIVTATGTIIESKYDTFTAQKLVYKSPYMMVTLGLLVFVLIMVLVDRWPWKRHQTGFVFAHFGLIILLYGSFVTMQWGLDASMPLAIGQTERGVITDQTELVVWASNDGEMWRSVYQQDVDFFLNPPKGKNKIKIPLPKSDMLVEDYEPYAFLERKFVASKETKRGAGVRFQIQNQFVNVIDWLVQNDNARGAYSDLGPARIVLVRGDYNPTSKNEIVLFTQGEKEEFKYEIHSSKDPKNVKRGVVAAGSELDTGWMGLKFRLLNLYPHTEENVKLVSLQYPTPLTHQAIKVSFNGQSQWVSLNALLKFFDNDVVYVVDFRNKRLELGFSLTLNDFQIGRYQGTMRASSYKSQVTVSDKEGTVPISMNEPLKHRGFTFYQASFQEDPATGRPTVSVLSVNRDPGRWLKYLGSFLTVLGIIIMFYFKKHYFGTKTSPSLNTGEKMKELVS